MIENGKTLLIPPQAPTSLAEKAYTLIEEMVVTLQLPPGHVFSESELSQKIEIGRTPMREALQRLAAERLLTVLPRRGVMVSEVNISEHLALLETRRVLDRLIAVKAARRATPAHREWFHHSADAITAAVADGRLSEFMRLDREFDQTVGVACRNSFAARATAPLHAHCRRFWYLYHHHGDLEESARLHRDLMVCLSRSEEEEAALASDRLLDYLETFTKSVLDI